MKWAGLLLACFAGWVTAGELQLPAPDRIRFEVKKLDAELYQDRMLAKKQLQDWASEFPRYMLVQLAEVYAVSNELEVVYQLNALLRELAGRVMFYQPKAFLGVNFELMRLPDGREVISLQSVVPNSPADRAGLKPGDFLLEVGGVRVEDFEDPTAFATQIQQQLPRESLMLRVLRKREFIVEVFLAVKETVPVELKMLMQEEDGKLSDWLEGLRPGEGISPEKPVGEFRLRQRRPPSSPDR